MTRGGFRGLVLDVEPLRASPAFRRLWAGQVLSSLGGRMTTFAVALQVYLLTGSSAAVGGVALTVLVPTLVVGVLGGSYADAIDRRTLVLVTTTCLAVVSIAFAVQAFVALDQLWLLYLLTTLEALLSAVGTPAQRTFAPRLLTPAQLPAGLALGQLSFQISLIGGAALAGLVASIGGLKLCYLIDALSFAAALYAVFRLPAMHTDVPTERPGLRAVAEGFRFIRRRPVVAGALLSDINATTLAMPFALFPAINALHFGGTPSTLGLLGSAPAVGGVTAMALSGPVRAIAHRGRGMLIASAIWGLSIAGFGLAPELWLALLALAIAGAADTISVVLRTTIVLLATPDEFRGRVSAADYVVGVGGPELGNFRGGLVASLTTPAISAVSGGIASLAGVVVLSAFFPALRRHVEGRDTERDPLDPLDQREAPGS